MQTTDAQPQIEIPPLRAVRQARGFGLREVARAAAIDPAHLSRVERGQTGISLQGLFRLAQVLGLRELASFLRPYANGDPQIGPARGGPD